MSKHPLGEIGFKFLVSTMRIKKCENCKWWQGELREYDDYGKFKTCYNSRSMISINSNDSCDNFEFNYMKKKIKKTKLKKVSVMTTKKGVNLYIKGIEKKIDGTLKSETLELKILQKDLKRLEKMKPLHSSDKLRIKHLTERMKNTKTKIREAKKYKKELIPKIISNNLEKLRKHPYIVGVEMGKKGFEIYTKPLMVKNKEIGYYQINFLYKKPDIVRIYNLYKGKSRDFDHWFIRRGVPCLSKWRIGLREYLSAGNIYLAVDTLIKFLTSNYHSGEGYTSFSNFTRNYL